MAPTLRRRGRTVLDGCDHRAANPGLVALAACAALAAGCGGWDDAAPQVLRLSVVTSPGVIEFDKERLNARAGRIAFVLVNGKRRGHNIRIHTGDECCFEPGSKDVGGTRTIGTGRTRAILDLEPGTYTYLCSAGGHWRTQHGTLVVRQLRTRAGGGVRGLARPRACPSPVPGPRPSAPPTPSARRSSPGCRRRAARAASAWTSWPTGSTAPWAPSRAR